MFKKNLPADALSAKFEAQKIAFAPMVFQAAKAMVDLKILAYLEKKSETGAVLSEVATATQLSEYAVEVLLECGLSAHIVHQDDDELFHLSTVGYFLLNDEMTKVNMNFVHDVCYQGMFQLQESLTDGRPAGLDHLGEWKTIYDALSSLPEKVKKSWFEFDHFYSDIAFDVLLPIVFEHHPLTLMDIGANTGKWAIKCMEYNAEAHLIAVDLPGQLHVAKQNIEAVGFTERVTFLPMNILGDDTLGHGVDLVWMSQFLCCFSQEEIVRIFEKVKAALHPDGLVCVLDTFWDTQRFEASAFSLHNTSLYFTAMANGNSKMYHSKVFKKCAHDAGLECVFQQDDIGVAHTLMKFKVR